MDQIPMWFAVGDFGGTLVPVSWILQSPHILGS